MKRFQMVRQRENACSLRIKAILVTIPAYTIAYFSYPPDIRKEVA